MTKEERQMDLQGSPLDGPRTPSAHGGRAKVSITVF